MAIICCIVAIVVSAVWLASANHNGADAVVVCAAAVTACLLSALWLFVTRRDRQGNLFHPVVFFMCSYIVVYYQIPLALTCGRDPSPAVVALAPFPEYINTGTILSTLGLAAFVMGSLVVRSSRKGNARTGLIDANMRVPPQQNEVLVRVLLGMGIACAAGFYLSVGEEFRSGVYRGDANWGTGASYMYVCFAISNACLAAAEFIRIAQIKPRSLVKCLQLADKRILAYWLVTHAPFVYAGDRGAYLPLVGYLVAPYFLLVRPLKLVSFLSASAVIAVLMTFAGMYRTSESGVSAAERLDRAKQGLQDIGMSIERLPTSTLAGSYRCFNTSIRIAQMRELPPGYYHGQFAVSQLLNFVPFSYRVPVLASIPRQSCTRYLTSYIREGDMASGMGSTSLSSPYIDFGTIGVAVMMCLLGAAMEFVSGRIGQLSSRSVGMVSVFMMLLFVAVYMNRSDILSSMQLLVWGYVLLEFVLLPVVCGAFQKVTGGTYTFRVS